MAPTVVIMWLTSLGKIRAATAHDYGTFRVTRAKLTALRPPVAENVSSWPDTSTICLYIYIYSYYMCNSITNRAAPGESPISSSINFVAPR